MKSTNLAEHVREVQSSLVGNGRFVHASNNKPFSAGTKGQLHGLSLNTGTEEATEKNQIPARQGCGSFKAHLHFSNVMDLFP